MMQSMYGADGRRQSYVLYIVDSVLYTVDSVLYTVDSCAVVASNFTGLDLMDDSCRLTCHRHPFSKSQTRRGKTR